MVEAVFTATSSATVTGLTVLTTSTDFTLFGQIILLCLIQLGGVGYMVLVALTLQLLGRRISLLNRLAISTSLGLNKPAAILRLLRQVVVGILLIEGIGGLAAVPSLALQRHCCPRSGGFYAVFHAVSAFCNAGFDLFVGLPQYPEGIPGDNGTLLILGALIFLGLGIPVFVDFSTAPTPQADVSHPTHFICGCLLTLVGWLGLFLAEIQVGAFWKGLL
ncbi:MAG: potassium transporter TrkG [Chloroflexota bacterium]